MVDKTEWSSSSASLDESTFGHRPKSPQDNWNHGTPENPESVSFWEVLFEAATATPQGQDREPSVSRGLAPASEVQEAGAAASRLGNSLTYASSRSSPGSPPEAVEVVTTLDPEGFLREGQSCRGPTPPWKVTPLDELDPAVSLPELPGASVGCPLDNAVTASRPKGKDVTSLETESGTAPVEVEEVDASAGPLETNRSTKHVTFSE